MLYKIVKEANINEKQLGEVFEAEPHAVELYIERGQIVEVEEEVKEVTLSEREQIKKELTEKGIEFKGNAKTEFLKELNQ